MVGLKKSNAKFFQKIRGVTFKLNTCDFERFICQSFVEKTLIRQSNIQLTFPLAMAHFPPFAKQALVSTSLLYSQSTEDFCDAKNKAGT